MPTETVTFQAVEIRKLLSRSRRAHRRLHSREQRNDPAFWSKSLHPVRKGLFLSDIAAYGRALTMDEWDLDQKSVPPGLILHLDAGLYVVSNDLDTPGRGFKSFAAGLAHSDDVDVVQENLRRLLSRDVIYTWGLTEEVIRPGLGWGNPDFVLKLSNLPDRFTVEVVPAEQQQAARAAWPDRCRASLDSLAGPA